MKGYTGGSFSIPHFAHYNFFRLCKQFCDYLVVSLNTDEFITEYKGKAPEFSYSQRVEILGKCPYINEIIPNVGGADSKKAISQVKPDVILIGQDWLARDYCKQMDFTPEWLTDNNISLIYLPHTDGITATLIRSKL
jgi:glycerol-3-phosphate cytidylyltransferase